MRVFADANILISVLNKEYPLFTHTARLLSLADTNRFTIYTSPVCLAIAFYFAEKKSGTAMARQKIQHLAARLSITGMGGKEVQQSLANKKITDIEDGMQYYSALSSKCTVIVTEDRNDYYFSDIEILHAEAFLDKYLLSQ